MLEISNIFPLALPPPQMNMDCHMIHQCINVSGVMLRLCPRLPDIVRTHTIPGRLHLIAWLIQSRERGEVH